MGRPVHVEWMITFVRFQMTHPWPLSLRSLAMQKLTVTSNRSRISITTRDEPLAETLLHRERRVKFTSLHPQEDVDIILLDCPSLAEREQNIKVEEVGCCV